MQKRAPMSENEQEGEETRELTEAEQDTRADTIAAFALILIVLTTISFYGS